MAWRRELLDELRELIPEARVALREAVDMTTLTVEPPAVTGVLRFLRDEAGFDMLTDVSAVDWLGRKPRFEVNYHLYALADAERLRVKVELEDTEPPRLPTATSVYPAADWHEREVFDFFGIVFDGHHNLKRILMPDEWIGHPLRKDYPVGGVPVEYRIEPAYVGSNVVPGEARPAAGGLPVRLRTDRGRPSHWTWTGPPASGVPPRQLPAPKEES